MSRLEERLGRLEGLKELIYKLKEYVDMGVLRNDAERIKGEGGENKCL